MKKRLIIFFTFVLFSLIFVPVMTVFSFEETKTSKGQVFYIPFDYFEREFQIVYTHSIHLTDVKEYFEVTDSLMIQALAMEYEDLAIGMPGNAEEGETLTIEDGKYRLSYEAKFLPDFTMHISNISSKQHFFYKNVEYDLKKALKKGSSYHFQVKKISLFQWLKGGSFKYE